MGLAPGELCYGLWDKPAGWLEGLYAVHNDHVLANVPKEQLLEFQVTQGWEPLCKFLGKPIPDEPFPHVNDSKSMERTRQVVNAITYSWLPVLGVGVYFAAKLLR